LLALLVLTLTVPSCTSFAEPGPRPAAEPSPARVSVTTAAPAERLTVLADPDPVAVATAASAALFTRAPVVVLAKAGDRAGTLLAASAAVGLGVPLLLEPEDGTAAPVAGELDRLGAETVLAVGMTDEAAALGPDVVSVPADPDAVATATGLALGPSRPVAEGDDTAAVADLDPDHPAALAPADADPAEAGGSVDERLPPVTRPDPLAGTVVLSTGGAETTAALATARAAGARVVLTDTTDPRGPADVRDALAGSPDAVVALGAAFADEDGLDWKVAAAETGVELPGGGQLLFPGRLLVALYGHPGTPSLGVLGEQQLQPSIQRAREHATPYESLVDDPVVPTFEIIATVASATAGADGNYSAESDPEDLRPWVEAAGDAGLYVVLDLQPGRADFLTQARRYESLLELPNVGLALDPEWRLGPDDVPLTEVGSVGIDEVNAVVGWLADLTREHALPQKLLVLHQFRVSMIQGREQLDTTRDELAVLIHADGQGAPGDKQETWRAVRQGAPAGVFWGWKNFYDEDHPMLTPQQTVDQVEPLPQLVSYQ
jgi:hypothetical protein